MCTITSTQIGQNEKMEPQINQHVLSISTNLEKEIMRHDKADNMLASFKIEAHNSRFQSAKQRIQTDFVVVIDTSNSMKKDSKLVSVLATIEYMLDVLSENDRLALVQFNETASILYDLDYLTMENKTKVLKILQTIRTHRNTNIHDGLFTALSILNSRNEIKLPISRILLLTDGHSNYGFENNEILQQMKQNKFDENLVIHSFGYGKDHCSSFLQMLSFQTSGGLYYYIEDSHHIAESFGYCISCIFSTIAYSVHVNLEAFDGCRFIKIATKYPFQSIKSMKNYIGHLGSIYSNETRSILMRLSLRKMSLQGKHRIFRVSLTYKNAFDHCDYSISKIVSIQRKSVEISSLLSSSAIFNKDLDQQVNRITSVEAIDKAIEAAYFNHFESAQKILLNAIQKIYQSATHSHSYSIHLIADLEDCKKCVSNQLIFENYGKHKLHQYSTMYNQERFVCIRNERSRSKKTYGYCSREQRNEIQNASQIVSIYFSAYGTVLEKL